MLFIFNYSIYRSWCCFHRCFVSSGLFIFAQGAGHRSTKSKCHYEGQCYDFYRRSALCSMRDVYEAIGFEFKLKHQFLVKAFICGLILSKCSPVPERENISVRSSLMGVNKFYLFYFCSACCRSTPGRLWSVECVICRGSASPDHHAI